MKFGIFERENLKRKIGKIAKWDILKYFHPLWYGRHKSSAISVRITAPMNPLDPKSTRMTNPYLHSSLIWKWTKHFWRFFKKSPKSNSGNTFSNQNKQKKVTKNFSLNFLYGNSWNFSFGDFRIFCRFVRFFR